MAKKSPPIPPNAKAYLTTTDVDGLPPADRIAREIVTGRRDLLPSVERIMNAELDADGTQRAMELFRDSLASPGDPNRDPRVAITAATTAARANAEELS